MELDPNIRRSFENKHYGIVGRHSGVEICSWTKKSLRGEGTCYKEKFYGVEAHRCAQVTPSLAWCHLNCVHCWRPMEFFRLPPDDDWDPPKRIVDGLIEARRKLLSGFGGNENVPRERYDESLVPSHWAISLAGEPTLYPHLPEMIRYIRSLPSTKTIFLVTNGQEPGMLRRLREEDALPTQLYLSTTSYDQSSFERLAQPNQGYSFDRFRESLSLLSDLGVRSVLRITLMKGINDGPDYLQGFADLINKYRPTFVEVKAYMWIGYSRNRLTEANMPRMEDVETFSSRLVDRLEAYSVVDRDNPSRIVLLMDDHSPFPKRIL